MKKISLLLVATAIAVTAGAQSSAEGDSAARDVRTGWTFGLLPSVAYDADLGLQYGALTNIYYFGDGKVYPDYYHSFYAEAAYTTQKYGLFRLSYDSRYLIPNHRLSVDLTYLPYKMQRDLFRLSVDLQGNITSSKTQGLYWNAGMGILNYNIGTVDIDALNKNKDAADQLPDTATLYDKYVNWGLIDDAERNGGFHPYLHGGITLDTRDRQQNPRRGLHADAFLNYVASVGDMREYNSLKFNTNFRFYIPLHWLGQSNASDDARFILAYRIGAQLHVAGKSPFYIDTYLNQLYMQRVMYEGLGGGNSLRGIMRNRILADGFAYMNLELRVQLFKFKIGKELFYVGINPFMDGGMVVQERSLNSINALSDNEYQEDFSTADKSHKPHLSAGCGLKVAMNDNFVLSVDWATALNEQDNGKFSNLYIKMGYMF